MVASRGAQDAEADVPAVVVERVLYNVIITVQMAALAAARMPVDKAVQVTVDSTVWDVLLGVEQDVNIVAQEIVLILALLFVRAIARAPVLVLVVNIVQVVQAAEVAAQAVLVVREHAAAVVARHVQGVKRVVAVQVVATVVERGAILDVQAHVKHLALVNVSAHVFRRVQDNLQLKF